MWRVGTAALLLLLLVVLVADMLFGHGSTPKRAGVDPTYPPALAAITASPRGQPAPLPAAGIGRDEGIRSEHQDSPRGDQAGPFVSDNLDGQSVATLDRSALDRLPSTPGDPSFEAWPGYPPIGYGEEPTETAPVAEKPAEAAPAAQRPTVPAQRPAVPAKPAVYDPKLADVQRKLAALGYAPGSVDGFPGKRTDTAIRSFQRDRGLPADGRVDDRLIARLLSEAARGQQLRQQELEAMAPEAPPKPEKPKDRGMFGAVLGGFQRLIGRDLNSVERPEEIASYCRANTDTWIYDFGREAFVYCGNIVAGTSRTAAAEGASSR